jgi:hypothetical protein
MYVAAHAVCVSTICWSAHSLGAIAGDRFARTAREVAAP